MDDDSSIGSHLSTTSSMDFRGSLHSLRNRVAEFTNMEVDYEIDEDQLLHAGQPRSDHLTYIEGHEGKRGKVKERIAAKLGVVCKEEAEIAQAEAAVNAFHAE